LRRVVHKKDTEKKKQERYTNNNFFVPEKEKSIIIYPIPEPCECLCGKPAIGMTSEFSFVCKECIEGLMKNTTIKQEKVLTVPSIDQATKGNAFEWQPEGKEQWYKINGSNITAGATISLSKEEIKKRFDNIMYEVLKDNPQICEGEYHKEDKKLVIFV
jgi:hypothetical protein